MKTSVFIMLIIGLASCQRYLIISVPEGDVHVQGNHLSVVDSLEHFRVYRIQDAYESFNQYNDVYQLLKQAKDPTLGLGLVHTQRTKSYQKRFNKILLKGKKSGELTRIP